MARLISNSGGRTSALMTFLEARKGLGPEDYVVFANTGKENPATLDFVAEQEIRWGIRIHWIEACPWNKWRYVDYSTASRKGEPFERLIIKRNYLPNWMTRFCTTELKIKPMVAFMRSMGYSHWDNLTGIRADEPDRLARRKDAKPHRNYDDVFPLAEAGITKPDVMAFWRGQPFNLQLEPHKSNCDLCFMKGAKVRSAILAENPEVADWWEAAEAYIGATFRNEHSVNELKEYVLKQLAKGRKFAVADNEAVQTSCFCGID